jgi:hypothetical protein
VKRKWTEKRLGLNQTEVMGLNERDWAETIGTRNVETRGTRLKEQKRLKTVRNRRE